MEKHKIKNLLQKLNDEDRNTLCCLPIKAGYAARIGKERPGGRADNVFRGILGGGCRCLET